MSDTFAEHAAPPADPGGGEQVDYNAALDPLGDGFGENLASYLADRDRYLLDEISTRLPAQAPAAPPPPPELTAADEQAIAAELDRRDVAAGDRARVLDEAGKLIDQHRGSYQGSDYELGLAALDFAASKVNAETSERGRETMHETVQHFARSLGATVDASKVGDRAVEMMSNLIGGGMPESRQTALRALYDATLEAARGQKPDDAAGPGEGPRQLMQRHLLVHGAEGTIDRHFEPTPAASQGPTRDANGRFASPRDVFAAQFGGTSTSPSRAPYPPGESRLLPPRDPNHPAFRRDGRSS